MHRDVAADRVSHKKTGVACTVQPILIVVAAKNFSAMHAPHVWRTAAVHLFTTKFTSTSSHGLNSQNHVAEHVVSRTVRKAPRSGLGAWPPSHVRKILVLRRQKLPAGELELRRCSGMHLGWPTPSAMFASEPRRTFYIPSRTGQFADFRVKRGTQGDVVVLHSIREVIPSKL